MDKRTSIRRLETLATFLETKVPRKHFDMGFFGNVQGVQKFGDCGTVGCALGWATTIPSFRKIGLRWDRQNGDIVFEYDRNFDAAITFFGIDFGMVDDLFGSRNTGQTPKQVAKRIRKLVAVLRA